MKNAQQPPVTRRTVAAAAAVETLATLKTPRVRRPRETRTQLLERLENPTLTLQEVSLLLCVCPATVRRYADAGFLKHERSAGGQRRFKWREVRVLMHEMQARQEKGRRR